MYYGCWCKKGFEHKSRKKARLVLDSELFCCSECFLDFLSVNGNKRRSSEILSGTFPVSLCVPTGSYSPSLKTWFRSGYEKIAAEFFKAHKIDWVYESRGVPFKGKGNFYVPDFFLPKHGYLVEVKGLWLGSGKGKFLRASKKLPILLLQERIIKDFSREIFKNRPGG